MDTTFTLISHHLCPYVQRAAIALTEKSVPFNRIYIDLSAKPHWFNAISPLGKVPVLQVDQDGRRSNLFESAAILEYLDEEQAPRLHPADALDRARNRAWIQFGSTILDTIARFYSAPDAAVFSTETKELERLFAQLEQYLGAGPYFNGTGFSLVDAVFGPVFRYFDVFDDIADFGILRDKPAVARWRRQLAQRDSVRQAVTGDYNQRLHRFLSARSSHLSTLVTMEEAG